MARDSESEHPDGTKETRSLGLCLWNSVEGAGDGDHERDGGEGGEMEEVKSVSLWSGVTLIGCPLIFIFQGGGVEDDRGERKEEVLTRREEEGR